MHIASNRHSATKYLNMPSLVFGRLTDRQGLNFFFLFLGAWGGGGGGGWGVDGCVRD